MEPKHKVLLVGGGHAMLPLLKDPGGISNPDVEITLINDHQYLYYSGMVPEFIGGIYSRDEIRINLKKLCEESGIRYIEDTATVLHPEKRYLETNSGDQIAYDLIAFDIGSRTPGLYDQKKSIPTKPLYNIERLKKYLTGETGNPKILSIIGGGAAGIEVALNVSAYYHKDISTGKLQVHIVEMTDRLVPMFKRKLSDYVTSILDERGVNVHVNTKPREIVENQITLSDGQTINSDFIYWATGSVGHPIFKKAGLPVDDQNFLKINNHLQCITYPEIFAAGDCSSILKQKNMRKIGIHAVKQGPLLKENLRLALNQIRITGVIKQDELIPYKSYYFIPLIISTGQPEAIWISNSLWLHGSIMLRLKHYFDKKWINDYLLDTQFEDGFLNIADTANAFAVIDQKEA
jgi:NADH dehydrogenase FAD-containing subunit